MHDDSGDNDVHNDNVVQYCSHTPTNRLRELVYLCYGQLTPVKVSTDQYYVTMLQAQSYYRTEVACFLKLTTTGSQAQSRVTCNQDLCFSSAKSLIIIDVAKVFCILFLWMEAVLPEKCMVQLAVSHFLVFVSFSIATL